MLDLFSRCEVAYHEAGHAVIGYLTGNIPTMATIVRDEYSSGRVEYSHCRYRELKSVAHIPIEFSDTLERNVLTTLAGSVAQGIYRISTGLDAGDDCDVSDATFLMSLFDINEEEDGPYISAAKSKVHEMLITHWCSVERVATELLVWQTLLRKDIVSLIDVCNI